MLSCAVVDPRDTEGAEEDEEELSLSAKNRQFEERVNKPRR